MRPARLLGAALSAMCLAVQAAPLLHWTFEPSRLVLAEGARSATLTVENLSEAPLVLRPTVHCWAGTERIGARSPDFLASPPVALLPGGASQPVRIVRTGEALPEDRETLALVQLLVQPGIPPDRHARAEAGVAAALKLVVRPAGLAPLPQAPLACHCRDGHLVLSNRTARFLTVRSLTVGGTEALGAQRAAPDVAPFGTFTAQAARCGQPVRCRLIGDDGLPSRPLDVPQEP